MILYTIAIEANTSSNQASKDPGHFVVAIVISVKFYRKKILAARHVAVTCSYALAENSPFPDILRLEAKVALYVANKCF